MGTMIKFAEATRDFEDSFIKNPIYKHNTEMGLEEAMIRVQCYGGILAMIAVMVTITYLK